MSCPRRRLAGSGYVKSDNPELEVQNNCAMAALMAAREAQDAALQGMWISNAEVPEAKKEPQLPPPVHTVPLSDTCFEVDGHIYKAPDVERAMELHKSLTELEAARAKEEAAWSAHWTQPPAVPAPAWETNTEIVELTRASDPLELNPDNKTDSETNTEITDLPTLEVSELN